MTTAELYQEVIAPAMYAIGDLWEKGALTVADEHLATTLTNRVISALRAPGMARPRPAPAVGRAVVAVVEGEQHALGARMVADLIEDVGYETVYLGADVPTDALLQAIASLSPDLLGLGATIPESAPTLEEVAQTVRSGNSRLEILVGGQAAPFCQPGEWRVVDDLERLRAP